jgi:hypothetical protein
LRASGSHDVVFEDVLVPFENAVDLRLPAEWLGADPQAQAEIAVLISALYTGVAEAARDWLLGFLHARKPSSLGASLATLPRARSRWPYRKSVADKSALDRWTGQRPGRWCVCIRERSRADQERDYQ